MKRRVLILGAGFGGLELATRLHESALEEIQVTLIDKNDSFFMGFSKFEVVFSRKQPDEIKSYYRDLAPAIDFRQQTITSIDPTSRHVKTDAGDYDADFLVIALGADMNFAATPGLTEGGQEFYTLSGAEKLSKVLAVFDTGQIVIGILGLPYKCPPAPFEMALQLHDYLTERGVRSKTAIRVVSPAPTPLPISKEGSETILRLFAERGIEFKPSTPVVSLDPSSKQAAIKDGNPLPYDLFIGVPVHRAPSIVSEAGLIQEGWISVNPQNLETRFPNVFAIGDVTKIPVGNAAVPKAGAFADRAAIAVADEILYRIRQVGSPGNFDGKGTCFLEFGGGMVAKVEANFLGGPAPDVRFIGPSKKFRADKDLFKSERLSRWFKK
ncbi:MAG TPA: FAD-dependent oxidoreductase [Acidobacteriota bacterium]|nr:FAD-dependent oxidoreductase [Acidobacteriota bacterium]